MAEQFYWIVLDCTGVQWGKVTKYITQVLYLSTIFPFDATLYLYFTTFIWQI